MSEISVIVPVYNVEKYLDKCITSIIEQTFTDFELILINDGSKDHSGSICDTYKEKDSRIKVIHQVNAGLSAARNVGIELSKGKYITFVDSDDFIHYKMLEVLYKNIQEYQADVSLCEHQLVYEDQGENKLNIAVNNNITLYTNIESIKEILVKGQKSIIVSWSKLYKRSLFSGIRFPEGKFHEDEFVTYKLLYKSSCIIATGAKLYYYLQRSNSITGSTFNLKRLDRLEALEETVLFFLEENNKELAYLAEFRYLYHIQIAYYRVKYEMNNMDVMNKLKKQYDQKYIEFTKNTMNYISFKKSILLRFFYILPNVYCRIVRAFIMCLPNLLE